MFLLPSIVVGFVLAVVLGGRPSRILAVRLRLSWTVTLALALQAILIVDASALSRPRQVAVHLASYALLTAFALANIRVRPLVPVFLGMALNGIAIAANNGYMPLSGSAAEAVGLDTKVTSNVSASADRLWYLGDVFALPSPLPLANVFSIGDILIGVGMAAFLVSVSLSDGNGRVLDLRRIAVPFRLSVYRRLAGARLISYVGDWITLAALVGWIYEQTGSTAQAAAVMLLRLAPPVLGGGLAALIVDRLPKQRLLVQLEIARGAVVGTALLAILGDMLALGLAALAVSGVLAAISSAAVSSLVPRLVERDRLASANAGLGVVKDVSMALGAMCAGLAVSFGGPKMALLVDVATFLAAAALYSSLRVQGEEAAVAAARRLPRGSGLRYLASRPLLVVLLGSFCLATVATGLTSATLPRFLGADLGLGAGGYGFGMAALGGGLALGQLVIGSMRVGGGAGRWIGLGFLIAAALFGLLGMVEHAATALLFLALIGFVDGTTDVMFETIVQRNADPRSYGAIFGFAAAFITATLFGSFSAAPVVNRYVSAGTVIVVSAGILVAAGLATLVCIRWLAADADDVGVERPVRAWSEGLRPAWAELPVGAPAWSIAASATAAPIPPVPEPVQPLLARTAAVVERPPVARLPVAPGRFELVIGLTTGEQLVAERFSDRAVAEARARAIVTMFEGADQRHWPRVGERIVRPAAVVYVELVDAADLAVQAPGARPALRAVS